MFEIEDPVRRAEALGRLGGAEERFFVQIGQDKTLWRG